MPQRDVPRNTFRVCTVRDATAILCPMSASLKSMPGQNEAERQARVDLAACYRLAARFGLNEGIDNHFTLLLPGQTDWFLVPPFGLHWSEIRAADFMVVDLAGRIISGRGPLEDTALYIHASVHRASPQGRCVLHTHMPYATALGMLADPHLAMAVQSALGSLVVGATVPVAFERLYFLERAAMAQVLALSTGRALNILPASIVQKTSAQFAACAMIGGQPRADLHFAALKRLLDRHEADYAS